MVCELAEPLVDAPVIGDDACDGWHTHASSTYDTAVSGRTATKIHTVAAQQAMAAILLVPCLPQLMTPAYWAESVTL